MGSRALVLSVLFPAVAFNSQLAKAFAQHSGKYMLEVVAHPVLCNQTRVQVEGEGGGDGGALMALPELAPASPSSLISAF